MNRLLGFGLVALLCSTVSAQLPISTLNGTVFDPQGAAVANAKVSIANQATGVVREANSDAQGLYTFANVPPGDYTVRVESAGFAKAEIKDVRLEVGRASTIDVKLSVAKAGEVVTVQIQEAQVDLTQSEVQGLVTSSTIGNIPLNGRNFLELAFLIPGNRPATNFDPTKTNTLEVSSAGSFGRGGNITVDGGDNNDEVVGGTLMNFPQDSVQEFQIATNKFTAEVGRSSSSIINIITKSGTNGYHGSGFVFLRHKALQAKPALSRDLPAPHFVREQFGGSVGGPIKKDRAFWFVSSEYRNQGHAVPVGERAFAPDTIVSTSAPAFVHDYLLTARTDFKLTDKDSLMVRYSFNRSKDIDNGSLRQALGTAANRQSSFNRFNSPLATWTRIISPRLLNSVSFHGDWFLNSIPSFSPDNPVTNPPGLAVGNEIRFPSLQDGANFRIPQSTKFNRYQIRDTLAWTVGKHTLRFGGEWQHLNTYALFDLYGSGSIFTTEDFATQDRDGNGTIDDRDIPIAVALKSAAPSRPPIVPFYPNSYFGAFVQDDWKVRSNLTLNLGLRWEVDDVLGQASNLHPCSSLTTPDNTCDFVENILGKHPGRDYKQFGPRIGFVWDPLKRAQTVVRGGYGIYYDRVVTEVPLLEALLNGRILPLSAFTGSTLDANGNFLPDPTTGQIVSLSNPFGGAGAVFGIGINHIANNAKHPYVQQFTLGLQHQIAGSWIISADGLHDFGQRSILGRLLRSTTSTSPFINCTNGVDPCTITDPFTGRSDQVTEIQSVAESWYDGLLVSLQKRPTGGLNFRWGFNANYTLSKTLNFSNDDQIPFNGAEDQVNLVEHVNNLRLEKSFSPTDERHRFVFFGVFDIPWKLTISPIWTYSSHVPMNSLVPALSTRLPILSRNALGREISNGAQLNAAIDLWNSLPTCTATLPSPFPCNSAQTFPLPASATPGRLTLQHVDPNLKFGDAFNALDLRLTKTWSFAREQNLQFIAEVFNLFNITNVRGFNNNNYSGYLNDITSSEFNKPLSTAGKFFGSGGARAFQFALRYSF
jgi:Carboxypeptidase regulatory-like domain/TonB dependent receptor-like, beta-barrel